MFIQTKKNTFKLPSAKKQRIIHFTKPKLNTKITNDRQQRKSAIKIHHQNPFHLNLQNCEEEPHYQPINESKLPFIYSIVDRNVYQQLHQLSQIFIMIQNLRQVNGVIAVDSEINLFEEPIKENINDKEIPYKPELHQMNEKICHLKNIAEKKITMILKMCKTNLKLKAKIQQEIQKQIKKQLEYNQIQGKINAMKAQKRIFDKNKEDVKKLESKEDYQKVRNRVKTQINIFLKKTQMSTRLKTSRVK